MKAYRNGSEGYVENAYDAIMFADKQSAENAVCLLSEGHQNSNWIATEHVFELK